MTELPGASVLLATYTDDSGDRIEYVLPEISESEVMVIEAFLRASYPHGNALVSVVNIEPLDAFTSSFGGEFEEFLAGAWKR